MVKIAFHTPQLDIRGSCTALYDYAHYNENLLGNESIIIVPFANKHKGNIEAKLKFAKRFPIFYYETLDGMDHILQREGCDIFYLIKHGQKDGILSKVVPNAVHCVFDMSFPQGEVQAAVSKTLAEKFGKDTYVEHMISLTPSFTGDNLRKCLGIPEDATVIGRHGGQDTFNLICAKKAIVRAINNRKDLYFLFVNTPVFRRHPQIIYLPRIIYPDDKNIFVMTCDAHIEAGSLGHTFGLSIGEFSVNNKPIIAYDGPVWNRAHLEILGNKAITFRDEESLYRVLMNFDRRDYIGKDLNCYREYNPNRIMEQFKRVFIDTLI